MGSRGEAGKATTPRERQAILAELERSGESVREFARRRGIPAGTISYWRHAARGGANKRRRRARDSGGRRSTELVELTPVEDVLVESRRAGMIGGVFELQLGDGRVVRIPPVFDADALGRLLRVLEAPC